MRRSIIVGIDPGVTYGIAILDTEGKLVHLSSKKHVKKGDIVRLISSFGHPVIIASDVHPCPKTVERLARNYGCKLWYPAKSLTCKEKMELIKEFEERVEDLHERDALAAAIKSYKLHSDIFRKIRNAVRRANVEEKHNEVIWKVIVEGNKNISNALNEVVGKEVEKRRKKEGVKHVSVEEYRRAVERLTEKIKRLKESLQSVRKELKITKRELQAARTSKIPKKTVRSIERLKSEVKVRELLLRVSKEIREAERQGLVPVLNLDKINVDVRTLHRFVGLRDLVIFTNDPSNLIKLNGYGIKAVLTTELLQRRLSVDYPIIDAKKLKLTPKGYVMPVSKELLESELKKARKEMFVEWLKKYKQRKL